MNAATYHAAHSREPVEKADRISGKGRQHCCKLALAVLRA